MEVKTEMKRKVGKEPDRGTKKRKEVGNEFIRVTIIRTGIIFKKNYLLGENGKIIFFFLRVLKRGFNTARFFL